MSDQTGAFLLLCEPAQLPFNPSNELLPSESIVYVFGERGIVVKEDSEIRNLLLFFRSKRIRH